MSKTRLTEAALKSRSRREGEVLSDHLNGLVAYCGTKGIHTWQIRHRDALGKQKKLRIGHWPKMSIAEARAAAQEFADRNAKGLPQTIAVPVRPGAGMTLGSLLDHYEQERRASGYKIKSLPQTMAVLRRGLAPFLPIELSVFSENDFYAAKRAMGDGRSHNGNRFAAYASAAFNWAHKNHGPIYREIPCIKANFASGRNSGRVPEQARDRVYTLEELAAIWLASERLEHEGAEEGRITRRNFGRQTRFQMLTGQRLGNAKTLRYGEILGGIWNQKTNKSNRPIQIPLSMAALREVGTGTDPRALVFGSKHGNVTTNIQGFVRQIRKLSGVEDFRGHDLRRSMASHMTDDDMEINPLVVDAGLLNHAMPKTFGTYIRPKMKRGKSEALEQWAELLSAAVQRARWAA